MITLERSRYRALRNMIRATGRGDFAAAFNWSLVVDGHIRTAQRLSDLKHPRPHRNWSKRKRKIAKLTPQTPSSKTSTKASLPR